MALTFLDFLCQPHTDLTCPLIFCMSFRHELHNILGESNWDIAQHRSVLLGILLAIQVPG